MKNRETLKSLKSANIKLTKENHKLVKKEVNIQTDLLKQLVDIRIMTDYHLDQVEQKTGEILEKDLLYCQELGLRILAFKVNNL